MINDLGISRMLYQRSFVSVVIVGGVRAMHQLRKTCKTKEFYGRSTSVIHVVLRFRPTLQLNRRKTETQAVRCSCGSQSRSGDGQPPGFVMV